MIGIGYAIRKCKCSLNLHRLTHQNDPVSQCVAESIRGILKPCFTVEEKCSIDAIEALRKELSGSTSQVAGMDYGAGNPKPGRTQEEMSAGVKTSDTLGHICRISSKPNFWCLFLFNLIRRMRPSSCIEMGTAVGISGAYQAAALKLNGQGTLVTLEGSPPLAEIARTNFERLELNDTVEVVTGRFNDTLPTILRDRQPIDYIFIDGHHDEKATLAYFEKVLPFISKTTSIIFDDITWSNGMKRAWDTITSHHLVSIVVDLGQLGLCVIDGSLSRTYYDIPLL